MIIMVETYGKTKREIYKELRGMKGKGNLYKEEDKKVEIKKEGQEGI